MEVMWGGWGSRSRGTLDWRTTAFLAAVARFKVGGLRQAKWFKRSVSVNGHWLGGQAHVVAALIQQRAAPGGQPMGALLKHRDLAWAWPYRQAGELIGAVSGEGAEPFGQPQVSGGEEMNSQMSGPQRHPVGVVGLGQPPQYRAGSMLDWQWNPTRQPALSCASAAVTTTGGASSAEMMVPSLSSDIAAPPLPANTRRRHR